MTEKLSSAKLVHVGIVVRDAETAKKYLAPFCLGPFTTFGEQPVRDVRIYGKPSDLKLKLEIADLGPVQVEILQPLSEGSPQKLFLDKNGEGIHHLAFVVQDLDGEVKKLKKQGYKEIMSLKWAQGNGGLTFVEAGERGGFIFELVQP